MHDRARQQLSGGLVAAAMLLLLNRVISSHAWLREAIEGQPAVLVQNGKVFSEQLRRESISLHELEAALRAHGVARLDEVASAVLEVDGTISVSQIGERTLKRLRRVKSSRTARSLATRAPGASSSCDRLSVSRGRRRSRSARP